MNWKEAAVEVGIVLIVIACVLLAVYIATLVASPMGVLPP